MNPDKFDAFTKALASGTSRRGAFRRIAGILGGTALAGLFPRLALADNSTCAYFCTEVFGPGPDRGQCISDAAHGKGLCYTCGPASPGGGVSPSSICCTRNTSGYCTSYSSATCCGSGQTCTSGTCVTTGLCNGTVAKSCTTDSDCPSGSNCALDSDGTHSYCTDGSGSGSSCTTDCTCPQGEFCESTPLPGGDYELDCVTATPSS